MRVKRLIVRVDKDKCTGCARCVEACLTGSLQIVDGKAELVDERRCDGFGSCISVCPHNALRLEFREVEEFDWELVRQITYEGLMRKLRLTALASHLDQPSPR
jgi:ferredoxin